MKDVKEIILYILIIVSAFFVIFAIIKYDRNKKELTTIIEQLRSAENRIVDITKESEGAGIIISNLRNAAEQERISYKELEEYSNQLEETIRKQREVYNRLTKSYNIDSESINRIGNINESNYNIVRGILKDINN